MDERSYDHEHGGGLHDLLVEQVSKSTSGFEISARSRARASEELQDRAGVPPSPPPFFGAFLCVVSAIGSLSGSAPEG